MSRILVPSRGPVLVVAPPRVPASWTGDETYKRLVQLTEALSADGWTVLAPWEYELFAPDLGDLLRASNVERTAEQMGLAASRLWIVEVSISESASEQTTLAERTGDDPLDAFAATRQHVLLLRVLDPRLDKSLGVVSASIQQDPFVPDASEVDALPNLTAAMPEVVDGLDAVMAAQGVEPPTATDPANAPVVVANPRRLETFALRNQASLTDRYGAHGDLEVLARSVVHYQFFEPEIDVSRIEQWRALPPGVLVVEPGALAASGVRPGDYLVEGNGVRIDGRHALDRFLRETGGGTTGDLTVLRGANPEAREVVQLSAAP